ncbi:MAG: methylated-DNA--[protein]-cysteine S-methyltransferase [Thermodesulfobacteriota bacterium]
MEALYHGRKDSHTPGDRRGEEIFEIGYLSPLGPLRILGLTSAVLEVEFCEAEIASIDDSVPEILLACRSQLDEYFKGKRKVFDLKLEPRGTAFQKSVWRQLLRIPYGETRSYKDIARGVGNIQAVRAVGMANGRNPISIIIPCHRVIGIKGDLVGYGGGLWRKQWLLDHERDGVSLKGP